MLQINDTPTFFEQNSKGHCTIVPKHFTIIHIFSLFLFFSDTRNRYSNTQLDETRAQDDWFSCNKSQKGHTVLELKIKTTGKADCGKIETTWNMFETSKSGNCYSSQEDEQC